MTGRILCNSKRLFLSLLILFGFSGTVFPFQQNLSGNLGQPKSHVVTKGVDRVTVDNVTGFSAPDTILLIQMQGVGILTDPLGSYGSMQTKFGEPGMWEFLIIDSVTIATNEIIFRNNIKESYDLKGNVQIVRVPYYNSATVTGTLYCDAWSPVTKSGGVIAMIIGRTLKLNANIDVSGKGFIGGKDTIGDGFCRFDNSVLYGQEHYARSFTNAGFKGEGLSIHNDAGTLLSPLFMKGMGPNFTGGGGGNARYSGGGGGSNRGAGGAGGYEDCPSFPIAGGLGGFKADNPALIDRIYLGAGGGASTTSLTGTSASGGNGGGIVIIISDTIIGNGGHILSNGGNGGNATGLAGAGGGGAAGSIALSLNSYGQDTLKFYLMGGMGGNNEGTFGEGGGGGGGLLWISTDITPEVKFLPYGGIRGLQGDPTVDPGKPGEKRLGFKAHLNGFLFNSIRSSTTGDQVDSICSNMLPEKLTGTKPVGGTSPYTYLWKKSYDQISWTPLVNDADPTNYTPTVIETSTVYFRRIVTDSSIPDAMVDSSKSVKIIVQPFIKNNIVGTSDTICFAQDPPLIHQLLPDVTDGNNKSYYFNWQDSTASGTWGSTVAASKDYDPPAGLIRPTWYRRTVTSGRCIDSTAIVKITVLDTISNNKILNSPPDICYGMIFTDLSATTTATTPALGGGDNSYRYKWESSTNGTTWVTATGDSSGVDYNPDELSPSFPGNEYYRRIVYSGMHDVCVNNSTPVLLKDFPVITNNTITANQTICSGSAPAKLIGSIPLNGNGIYTCTWQDSTKSHPWTDIPGAISITIPDYQPPALTDTTSYRRIVFSSACSDISNSIIINVHKPIAANNIFLLSAVKWDTTICSGATPRLLKGSIPTGGTSIPGDYAYEWESSASKTTGYTAISGATGKDYQPGALTVPTYFRRKAISGTCAAYSDSVISIIVLPLISNNTISTSKTTVCKNSVPALLTGSVPSGGAGVGSYLYTWRESPDGITWTNASGPNPVNARDYQPPALTTDRKYKRIVRSGSLDCCIDSTGILIISIDQLPTGTITTITDTTVCSSSAVPVKIHLTGTPNWRLIYAESGVQTIINKIQATDTTLLINRTPAGAFSSYVFKLDSLKDSNKCVALPVTLTGTRKIDVYRMPVAKAGNDTTVCGPTVLLKAAPSAGTGKWYENSVLSGTTVTLTVTVPSFAGGNVAHTFRWEETNWQCRSKDSVIVTFDKPVVSADAGPADTTLWSFDRVIHMVAKPIEGWENGLWSKRYGESNPETSSSINEIFKISTDSSLFLWTVTNGKCLGKDSIKVRIYDIIIPRGFSPNADSINDTFIIKGLDLPNQVADLKILTSAGVLVFATTNKVDNNAWRNWDGKNSRGIEMPEGTYYYLLIIKSKDSPSVYKKSGFLVLKRY